ncbi:MAG: ABC transporter substrate-binding protein [Halorhabdus sp.]
MSNDHSSDRFEDVVNRRNFMRLAGASGAAMLAGCGGGGDTTTEGPGATATETPTEEQGGGDTTTEGGDTTTEGGGGESKVYDVTVESVAARSMDMLDWNSQYAGWPNIWGRWLAYERFAQYNITENEWIPQLIQDWSIDGTTVTLNIRDPHKYQDGDPVTADDIKANIVCNLATGAAFSEVFKSFNAPDEKTLEIETTKPVNKSILEFTILSGLLQAKMAPPYDKFYTRYWENNEEGVGKAIQDRAPKQPDYVSGIFGLKSMNSQQYIMQRNPQHPDAENATASRPTRATRTSGTR